MLTRKMRVSGLKFVVGGEEAFECARKVGLELRDGVGCRVKNVFLLKWIDC